MNDRTRRKLRVFFCVRGGVLYQQVTDILRDLDIPLEIDSDSGRKDANPNTDIAIGIWVEGTRLEPDFFRELSAWDARANTDVFICRLGGPRVDSIPPEIVKGVYDYDGGKSLKEWLLRDVLEIDEAEHQGPSINNLDTAIRHYNREFRQRLRAAEVLNGMHGVVKKPLVDAYVPLCLVRKGAPDLVADEGIVERLFREEGRRVFVTGVPGSGKSTFTRLLAFYMTAKASGADIRLPIVLRAKSIFESGVKDLTEGIKISIKGTVRTAGKAVSDLITAEDSFPASQTILMIDGLDELDDDERVEVRRLIKAFEILHPRCSILVTARPSAYDKSRWSDYLLYRISPLTADEALAYVSNHGNGDTAEALRDLINTSEPVRELAEVPFMLALMANYAGSALELPKQRAQLISQCVLAVLERRRVRTNDRLEEEQLVECLTYISHRLFRIDPSRDHSEQEFLFAIQAFLSSQLSGISVPYHPSEAAVLILEEVIENTGLLQRAGKSIEFVHRTVWEFFVARFLANDSNSHLLDIARQKVWEEPIRLATGMVAQDRVDNFTSEVWSVNAGLALRALSESPYDTEKIIARNLERKSPSEVAILVRDLRSLLIEHKGRSGSERVTLDTIRELLPRTISAEILWEIISTLILIEERTKEAAALITSALALEGISDRFQRITQQLRFIDIPGGTFLMGTNREDRTVDERPAHEVSVGAFRISKITVRNRDIEELSFSVGRPDPARSPTAEHPVIWVTWYEAQMTAIWFGCRLPTEAEWEFACRSGGEDDPILSLPERIPEFAWFAENAENRTHVGCSLKANAWGVCDMLGNVREWCSDWYQEDLYSTRVGMVAHNPFGPPQGTSKVLRGGCFDWNTANLVPTYRNSNLPANRGFQNGIRLVAGLPLELASFLERANNDIHVPKGA